MERLDLVLQHEYRRVVDTTSKNYNSAHENYAISLEELQEAAEELQILNHDFEEFWKCCRRNQENTSLLRVMKEASLRMAAESIQLAVTFEKGLNGYGNDRN